MLVIILGIENIEEKIINVLILGSFYFGVGNG